jgi:hypothetical protein
MTITLYEQLGIPPPLVVMLTLVSVREHELATGASLGGYNTHHVDRDDLILPDALVQDYSKSPIEICRPIFDALFNAAGYPKWPK